MTGSATLSSQETECSDPPHDEACDDSGPGDTAGLGPLGVLIDVLAAAAHADQVHGEDQQAHTQTHGADARQKYQRLREVRRKTRINSQRMKIKHVKKEAGGACVVWKCQTAR